MEASCNFGRSGVLVSSRKKARLSTGPSCALKVATGQCSASGVRVLAEGVHTAIVPSADAEMRRSGPPGSRLPIGSSAVTAPLCAPDSLAYTYDAQFIISRLRL